MAMALLQPQQQQQQHQGTWFYIDFEEDGGIYEMEVDLVGSCIEIFYLVVIIMYYNKSCA